MVDPFAGSATTVVAAVYGERRVIACEKDVDIFSVAVERIKKECDVGKLF